MIHYFGTDLTSAGHYFFELNGNSIHRSHINFGETPFNPEQLPTLKDPKFSNRKGYLEFHQFAGYTIIAIEGSCKDQRGGTKSIFFVKEIISQDDFLKRMINTPIVMKMINQMPFPVDILKTVHP